MERRRNHEDTKLTKEHEDQDLVPLCVFVPSWFIRAPNASRAGVHD